MKLRESHPVLAEALSVLRGVEPVELSPEYRARLERVIRDRFRDEEREAGIRNVVRLARYLETELESPEAAHKLIEFLAWHPATDEDLRIALRQAGDRLAAAAASMASRKPRVPTMRSNQFAIPMRG